MEIIQLNLVYHFVLVLITINGYRLHLLYQFRSDFWDFVNTFSFIQDSKDMQILYRFTLYAGASSSYYLYRYLQVRRLAMSVQKDNIQPHRLTWLITKQNTIMVDKAMSFLSVTVNKAKLKWWCLIYFSPASIAMERSELNNFRLCSILKIETDWML